MSELGLMDDHGHGPQRHRREPRRRRAVGGVIAVVVSLAVIAGIGFGVVALRGQLEGSLTLNEAEDYTGDGSGDVVVVVESGDSVRAIGNRMADADVVASADAFVDAAVGRPESQSIAPGSYTMRAQMSADSAVELVLSGDARVVSAVQVPEGLRIAQLVPRVAEQGEFSEDDVAAAIAAVELPEYAGGEPEGFLFPATYEVDADATPQGVVDQMVARFEQAAGSLDLQGRAEAADRTPREVVTVASIVQREVGRVEDMPGVAGVIYNRLAGRCEGVPTGLLQMDSTVHFAVNDYSTVFTTDEQRQSDSPYNTYRVTGLPPGPIAAPGEEALEAALSPADDGSCYFSAVNLETGETRFAETPAQHQANVAELQAYCRENEC